MAKDKIDHEAALHDQTNLLPKRQLIPVFFIMALSLCVCFIDQNGIGVLLPDIAKDLHAQSTIAWAGTSALIANTVFQVLYGRLSDLFGRKKMLVSALVLLAFSDLICGLAPNSTVLYVFRGLAGVANGGITSLTMMIVSDIVTLRQRGKYQGILGTMVGTGNAIGPLIAAGFAEHTTWRGLFYLLAPIGICAAISSWRFLPSNMPKTNFRETVGKVDFWGLLFGTLAIILILIPVSEGGHGMPWSSPTIIAMLSVGSVCAVLFIVAEWKWAKLPMMPLSMYTRLSVAVMLLQSFLLGACYYSYLYYLPLYYQNVRGYSVLKSALLLLPLVGPQSLFSIMSGLYMSRMNRYGEILWIGFAFWTLGSGLLITCNKDTSPAMTSGFLVLIGTGTGFTFQPTLVALQAHCSKAQRAVVTSNRNFLRSLGGAVSLAVSAALLGNVLKSSLPPDLQYVASSTFATPDLATFSHSDRLLIEDAYASASRAVFIWCCPLIGACFLGCAFIKDQGLQRKEEKVEEKAQQEQLSQGRLQDGSDVEKSDGVVDVDSSVELDAGTGGAAGAFESAPVDERDEFKYERELDEKQNGRASKDLDRSRAASVSSEKSDKSDS